MKSFVFAAMAIATATADTATTAAPTYPTYDAALRTSPTGLQHGIVTAAETGAIGATACPVKCKSTSTEGSLKHPSSLHKGYIVQVYHATSDATTAHSTSNVVNHVCKHNVDLDRCVCECPDTLA